MNDKELADKLLEVLDWHSNIRKQAGYHSDNQFVCHWDVAGAIMKRVADEGFHISMGVALAGQYDCHMDHLENDMRQYSAYNESLPRAINEAGVEVLEDVGN